MIDLPFIDVSVEAQKHIKKRGSVAIISRNPKAGRYGYSGDALVIKCSSPEDTARFYKTVSHGITFYLHDALTLENYEQLNVWLRSHYGIFKSLRVRITLYRRFPID
ncbi:MAG: hypothetical protein LAT57_04805 [Balneolales bacterium]|nr:hypothetical protein [Balneolales bacterium]